MPVFLQGTVAAAFAGTGCGSCCGSGISAVLFGYLTTHARSVRQTLQAFLTFYLGKVLSVSGICLASSLLGSCVLGDDGCIGNVPFAPVIDLLMVGTGVFLAGGWLIRFFQRRNASSCAACSGHCTKTVPVPATLNGSGPSFSLHRGALFVWGVGYGISPCAPLLLMAGYCAALSPAAALLSGAVFALSSSLVPMILVLTLCGILSPRLHREVPGHVEWFRFGVYLLLMILFLADLIRWF